jgi:hypothetical protein
MVLASAAAKLRQGLPKLQLLASLPNEVTKVRWSWAEAALQIVRQTLASAVAKIRVKAISFAQL